MGRKSGSANYINEDVDVLLELVGKFLPIGAKEREGVAVEFNQHAPEVESVQRDGEGLKAKFDKLGNEKKPTGRNTCPPHVPRAEEVTRAIKEKVIAITGGAENSDAELAENIRLRRERENGPATCESARKRIDGAGGGKIKREREKGELTENVGMLTKTVCSFLESRMKGESSSQEVKNIVKKEVKENLKEEVKEQAVLLQDSMDDLKTLLSILMKEQSVAASSKKLLFLFWELNFYYKMPLLRLRSRSLHPFGPPGRLGPRRVAHSQARIPASFVLTPRALTLGFTWLSYISSVASSSAMNLLIHGLGLLKC